ncbi:hypothetical protein [Roseomonas indoligenes]|uniref:Uncharacterized protein n=1 Tax=Roseomonas indoligenes TaxID=2820811 RepID=A0A940MT57_9PROT|nr:hypothetical protein [Pararoseomonas indoligenes]MBP0492949.1 hypothetical protein [Pararoseomonas indoligenes]
MNAVAPLGNGTAELRLLSGALADASREQLARVVSLIDELPDRAGADSLLERARPRLRELNLPRPLGFTRLLFLPFDMLIVPPSAWAPGGPAIPRTALRVLSAAVEGKLGPEAARIDADCAGLTAEQPEKILTLGRMLWPAAAHALPGSSPEGWEAAGLPAREYPVLRERCAAGWRHAVAIWPALQAAAEGPPEVLARQALEGAAAEGGAALEVALRMLMARASRPASLATLAIRLSPSGSAQAARAAQGAVDEYLHRRELGVATAGDRCGQARRAAADALAVCVLAEDFEASGLLGLPARRERLQAIRRATADTCRESFAGLLSEELLGPLAALGRTGAAEAHAILPSLEEAARLLRRIEGSGRRLGGAETYDFALNAAAAEVADGGAAAGLAHVERLRLVEMLAGPEAALRLVGWP